jgi:hypothetical protein
MSQFLKFRKFVCRNVFRTVPLLLIKELFLLLLKIIINGIDLFDVVHFSVQSHKPTAGRVQYHSLVIMTTRKEFIFYDC